MIADALRNADAPPANLLVVPAFRDMVVARLPALRRSRSETAPQGAPA